MRPPGVYVTGSMFGNGLYFADRAPRASSTPSAATAERGATATPTHVRRRVALGKIKKYQNSQSHLSKAPPGFHSVPRARQDRPRPQRIHSLRHQAARSSDISSNSRRGIRCGSSTSAKTEGQESTVTGYWLIEAKRLFSIALLRFDNGSRESYHSHAFNSISWLLSGYLREESLDGGFIDHTADWLWPIITRRKTFHRVFSSGTTWVLRFRARGESVEGVQPQDQEVLSPRPNGRVVALLNGESLRGSRYPPHDQRCSIPKKTHEGREDCPGRYLLQNPKGDWYCVDCGLQSRVEGGEGGVGRRIAGRILIHRMFKTERGPK